MKQKNVIFVFLVKDPADGRDYVLLGKRSAEAEVRSVPSGNVGASQSPLAAAEEIFYTETGLRMEISDRASGPCAVSFPQLAGLTAEMRFTGVYTACGGESEAHCFAVYLQADPCELMRFLSVRGGMEDPVFVPVTAIAGMDLTGRQKDAVIDALRLLDIDFQKAEDLAVVTPAGEFTGAAVPRGVAHSEGVMHGASHIYICRRNAAGEIEILLQRRSHNKDTYADCLDTSSAGHVEAGMDYLSTALKELAEELGLVVPPTALEFAFDQTVNEVWQENGKTLTDREYDRVYFLWMDPPPGTLSLQKEEVSEVLWLPLTEISGRIAAGDAEICINPAEFSRVEACLRSR